MVVSNTSPIVALAAIGRLDLLRAVHGEIAIPSAVFDEIAVAGAGEPGAREVTEADWVKRYPVANTTLVNALGLELDAGEAQAIALAVEIHADLILLDERLGRRAARRLGLTINGTLGVIIAAKDLGLLPSVRPILDALRVEAGFWIGNDLYSAVLAAAAE
jgi:predicted nucleic acid-binding protein